MIQIIFAAAMIANTQLSIACDRSSLTIDSVVPNGSDWDLTATLCLGAGITGVSAGADGDTKSFAFGFFKTGITISNFTPSVTSDFTGATLPGVNAGAFAGAEASIVYVYSTTPFTCISSTAVCGDVATDCKTYDFTISDIPDSVQIFGAEGNGNPVAGCYGEPAMSAVPPAPTPVTLLNFSID